VMTDFSPQCVPKRKLIAVAKARVMARSDRFGRRRRFVRLHN
jgi:hypothetical protein